MDFTETDKNKIYTRTSWTGLAEVAEALGVAGRGGDTPHCTLEVSLHRGDWRLHRTDGDTAVINRVSSSNLLNRDEAKAEDIGGSRKYELFVSKIILGMFFLTKFCSVPAPGAVELPLRAGRAGGAGPSHSQATQHRRQARYADRTSLR